jgi:hypothetical protein
MDEFNGKSGKRNRKAKPIEFIENELELREEWWDGGEIRHKSSHAYNRRKLSRDVDEDPVYRLEDW